MNRDRAREELKTYLADYVERITEKSKSGMYVCPLCNSGTGKNGTGAFSIKREDNSWKCFSCNEGGDIFDLIGKVENIADYNQQIQRAGELFNISINNRSTAGEDFKMYQKHDKNEQHTHNNIHTTAYTQQHNNETDYTAFILEANKHIKETSYLQERGISVATAERFKLGFCKEWRHPKAKDTAPTTPRLIIPTSKYSYVARATSKDTPKEDRYKKAGTTRAFNIKALEKSNKPIFIVEGELDALSIIEVGGEAIALGSTAMVRNFINLVKEKQLNQPILVALDNDNTGIKASTELIQGLKENNIKCYNVPNLYGEHKDANEALQQDREAFTKAVEEAEKVDEVERKEYLKTSTAHYLQDFINGIADSINTPYIETGFKKLDEVLDGGLYEGLYCMGAISSLGKTTFVLQVADQIAQSGKDVLIFSLEMARTELISKSISRLTLEEVLLTEEQNIKNAKTARGITTGKRYEKYSKEEKELIKTATEHYGNYADHIYISEGIGDIGAMEIREAVEKHIRYTGNTPVVVIDYLQILAPYNEKYSDKQNTDKSVTELKRISRDFKLPIIAISSFNRQNYSNAVDMEAFKESGAIEYSSDVLIGLQLKGAGGGKFDVNEAKKQNPREIELVILKNRNGRTGDKIPYKYYALFNQFSEE